MDKISHNYMVGKISQQAGELSVMTVRELRLRHPDNVDGTVSGSQWQGMSKSRLIADILYEAFDVEFDYELPLEAAGETGTELYVETKPNG